METYSYSLGDVYQIIIQMIYSFYQLNLTWCHPFLNFYYIVNIIFNSKQPQPCPERSKL